MENELMTNGRKQTSGASCLCNQPARLIVFSIFDMTTFSIFIGIRPVA